MVNITSTKQLADLYEEMDQHWNVMLPSFFLPAIKRILTVSQFDGHHWVRRIKPLYDYNQMLKLWDKENKEKGKVLTKSDMNQIILYTLNVMCEGSRPCFRNLPEDSIIERWLKENDTEDYQWLKVHELCYC